jgi:leucyl-tRNA synthetase
MAVPAHDERDFAFAKQFQLPIIPVYEPTLESVASVEELDILKRKVFNGDLCWPGEGVCANSSSNTLKLNGLQVPEAKTAVIQWLEKNGKGKFAVTYKLRDWLFSRQRYWGEPFPVLHFADGSLRVLSIDELPLCPPVLTDFKPTGDGLSPLARVPSWIHIVDPVTGKDARRETNTMPQWAGSCWYYLRFCDPMNESEAWGREPEQYWLPVDMYVGGVEHAVLHLLYARFWHKVLYDCKLVSTPEPFKTLRNQGLIVARSFQKESGSYVAPEDVEEKNGQYYHRETDEILSTQVEKMSKSKLNGITPDDIIEEFGADSLRLYEMFMGPLEKEKIWNTDAVQGCRRFLARMYDLAVSDKVGNGESEEALRLGHRLVHGVQKDIEAMQFNTAIAKMMEFVNDFTKLPSYPRSVVKMAVLALAPFAPHAAEELWEILGGRGTLAYEPYPQADLKYLEDATITYVVQVNGKLRGRFELPKDQSQEAVVAAAKQNPHIAKYLDGAVLAKVVFVPNKILNFVLKMES